LPSARLVYRCRVQLYGSLRFSEWTSDRVDFDVPGDRRLPARNEFNRATEGDSMVATLSPAIRAARTTDGYVLLDTEWGQLFCLNPVGSRIFDLLQQGLAENRIVSQIVADYAVSCETAQADVHEFLESLFRHHIFAERQGSQQGEKRGDS
jgi:hypothetical protein